MSDVNLSASIRQNLLSLQNTTKLLASTSNRLSTGLRVNSALDNPASFFAARSLTNRANDLDSRKTSIGQAISLLQSTDKNLTSLVSLVEQAKAKAIEADEAATGGITAISSEKAATIAGSTTISSAFSGSVTGEGITLATVGATTDDELFATINGAISTFAVGANSTVGNLVSFLDGLDSVSAVFNTTSNQIDITGPGGSQLVLADDGTNSSFFGAGELGGFKREGATVITDGDTLTYATNNTATDLLTDVFGLTDGNILTTTVTSGGTNSFTYETGDDAVASTIQDLLDNINAADTALTATYNTVTSKIDVKAAEGVAVDFSGNGFANLTLNDGTNNLVSGTDVTFSKLGSASEVGALTTDFQLILNQIDALINDSSFKGTNLLKGAATLDVKFNVKGDSKLTILGKSLGIDSNSILSGLKFTQKAADYDFTTAGDLTAALADVDAAITELRSVASTFGTSLGIIQTREEFTTDLVNSLEIGAGKLVNANLEEEAAKLLALQTRQALGIQSLSIANTSQQSILALFR